MLAKDFRGTYTALVTPFDTSFAIEWSSFDKLIDAQLAGGITGIVPCGTTGESPALTAGEQEALVKRCVERAKGKTQIIAGTGSNSTKTTIELATAAKNAGADAIMVVVPYYNKPTQEGLFLHYTSVAAAVPLPMMIYNIPGRTGIDLLPDTVGRILEKCPSVVAMKEATGNILRAQELVRRFGSRLSVLSGDDALTLGMTAVGGSGVVSVATNLFPTEITQSTALALSGSPEARAKHLALVPVYDVMFTESNPGPVKYALERKGQMRNILRAPMAPISEASQALVSKVVAAFEGARA